FGIWSAAAPFVFGYRALVAAFYSTDRRIRVGVGSRRKAAARHRFTYVVGHDGGVRTAVSAAVAAAAAWSLRSAISSTMEVVYGTSVRLVSVLSRFDRAPENAARRRA